MRQHEQAWVLQLNGHSSMSTVIKRANTRSIKTDAIKALVGVTGVFDIAEGGTLTVVSE